MLVTVILKMYFSPKHRVLLVDNKRHYIVLKEREVGIGLI